MDSIQPVRQTWDLDMSSDRQVTLYRDWGVYFSHKHQLDFATRYFDLALSLEENDVKSLFHRSVSKRGNALANSAIADAQLALEKTDISKAAGILEVCSCIYEMNEFEKTKAELYNGVKNIGGSKITDFKKRLCIIEENINDSLGPSLKPFIVTNAKLIEKVNQIYKESLIVDDRPLWKTLRDQDKCDVLSVLEKEQVLLSPRELARRKCAFKIYNQTYINRSSIDVLFLKNVRKSSTLLLPYSKESTRFLKEFVETKYQAVKKFIKMLNSRSPMYNEDYCRYPNRTVRNNHFQAHIYRVENQTRRNMVNILRNVKLLRESGNTKQLSKYIEEVMAEYVSIKTHLVMPWKLEFVREVYHTLGLAYIDKCTIPKNAKDLDVKALKGLLYGNPPAQREKQNMKVEFGVRKQNQDIEGDNPWVGSKQFLFYYEKRMIFSPYDIEKGYLYHEMAKFYLEQSRFDECCANARKGVAVSKACKSNLWAFLNCLLTVKAHAALAKVQHEKDALAEALKIAIELRSQKLQHYIGLCLEVNRIAMTQKKERLSVDTLRKRSRKSMESSKTKASEASSHDMEKNGTIEISENALT